MSHSWLYRQDELRRQIDQLRDTPASRASSLPTAERATLDSLCHQLRVYRSEIVQPLENQALGEQHAHRLGGQRAAAITSPR